MGFATETFEARRLAFERTKSGPCLLHTLRTSDIGGQNVTHHPRVSQGILLPAVVARKDGRDGTVIIRSGRNCLILTNSVMYITHVLSSQISPYVHNARMRIYYAATVQHDAVVALPFQMPLNDPFLSTYYSPGARMLCPIADPKPLDMRPARLDPLISSRSL